MLPPEEVTALTVKGCGQCAELTSRQRDSWGLQGVV